MIRTKANTDVEKAFDYKCRRKHSLIFCWNGFSYTNQISSPSSAKKHVFKKVWPYFHRCFAKYVFARPGREKRPLAPRKPKGGRANPIKKKCVGF